MSETEGGMRGDRRGRQDGASPREADNDATWKVDHYQHHQAPRGRAQARFIKMGVWV